MQKSITCRERLFQILRDPGTPFKEAETTVLFDLSVYKADDMPDVVRHFRRIISKFDSRDWQDKATRDAKIAEITNALEKLGKIIQTEHILKDIVK